jgi:hypothetical protein
MDPLMNLPHDIKVYGDLNYRGACPKETLEQVTFFNRLRRDYPDTLGIIAFHVRNEGKRTHLQAATEKAEGMTAGAPDILIPGAPAFVCELKRRDHTQSELRAAQLTYLRAAQAAGSFVCVALGVDAAWEALHAYLAR